MRNKSDVDELFRQIILKDLAEPEDPNRDWTAELVEGETLDARETATKPAKPPSEPASAKPPQPTVPNEPAWRTKVREAILTGFRERARKREARERLEQAGDLPIN